MTAETFAPEDEPSAEIQERLQWAVSVARRGGEETIEWFCHPELSVDDKRDGSPVTVADRNAEQCMREEIAKRYPADAIVGEEFEDRAGTTPFRWTLDPIDGTKSFVAGVPLYTTLVGVLRDEDPVVGVIHAPATGEIVYAAAGGPCRYVFRDRPAINARVSSTASLTNALFVTTSVQSFDQFRIPPAGDAYVRMQAACRMTRTWGDAYGYLLVATGRADVMVDPIMNLWDTAPLLPIIHAAGGRFTDWQGQATIHSGEAVASNGQVHAEVLALLDGPVY